jgi:hypothetical protein
MEVHAHTHTERKKWTHYLWEFLMLFLAVFAGFIAENLRENFVERQREKQYIVSLIDDLKKDTFNINQTTRLSFKISHGQDSLIDLLHDFKDTGNISAKCYRYYFLYTTLFPKVGFNERTISQLLNAGNMRLIEKAGMSDSIMNYSLLVKAVQDEGEAYMEYFKKTLDLSISIFDFSLANGTLHENYTITPRRQLQKNELKFLTTDSVILKKYAIQLSLSKTIFQTYVLNIKEAKDKAASLIALLKKKYHLE